ncbi:MAG: RTX toxin, partial [Burkholderiales bacterium]|uniref:calcium-binding protein n=1 Tax=Limnobacter sp. TaxID=2003368 RepID=UPI0039BD0489|nr:RTX toxin [Burkholderiales bacterium]
MYSIGIRIVYRGNNSDFGHMYVVLTGNDGKPQAFGQYPVGVINIDMDREGPNAEFPPDISRDFPISQSAYERALAAANQAQADSSDFSKQWGFYDPFSNSCVDFAWWMMRQAGLTEAQSQFEGYFWPSDNTGAVDDTYYDYFRRPEFNREFKKSIATDVNDLFLDARNFVIQVDPLVLDLDGDGLELVSANGSILFDHNADNIKTGTGWAGRDDGFLVRDLNGNGTIDTGRELFGVDTIKSNNTLAAQGFDALRDLDSNADGQITSADTAYGELKIWQDANQDGISQSTELKTLAERGITRIGLNGTSTGPQAGQTINNNQVALSTTFTQNGQTKTVGAIDLEANNFFTEFPTELVDETGNPVAITEQALNLPQMNGSGMVRNMQAAASLDADFAAALTAFAAGTTCAEQRGMLDDLVTKWSETSSFAPGLLGTSGVNITFNLPPNITVAQYTNMINVLEKFNGSRFYGDHTGGPRPAGFAISQTTDPLTGNVVHKYIISPPAQQVALLQNAYNAIKESVYGALVVQTRLKPYLDAINLEIKDTGIRFDLTQFNATLAAAKNADLLNALIDLVELVKYQSRTLQSVGFDGTETLREWIAPLSANSPLLAELATLGLIAGDVSTGTNNDDIYVGNTNNNTFNAGQGDDTLDGGTGNDYLSGAAGNDTLVGGAGSDSLYGGEGNDLLDGGTGNDYLYGGTGNNTYLFGKGDGQDTIGSSYDTAVNKLSVLQFKAGVTPAEVIVTRSIYNHLVLSIAGTTDKVTIQYFFHNDNPANEYNPIQQVSFADGTSWNIETIKAMAITGNDTDQNLSGYNGDDTIDGLGGNDTVNGRAGNDTLNGGEGNDIISGGDGADSLLGGAGSDSLYGGEGNDLLDGGTGNDYLNGGTG